MKQIALGIISLCILLTSCKGSKTVTESNVITVIPTKALIDNHYDGDFGKNTINARLSAKYRGPKSSATITIKLRLEKDKTIWMSATKLGIPVAKVKITPKRVIYYEKLQKVYFDGDFSLLSSWLGTELNFEKVQNILLGQSLFDLKKGKYISEVKKKGYQLTPKKNNKLYKLFLMMNPDNFKMNRQEIMYAKKDQALSVSYPRYKDIQGEQFPENIKIMAVEDKKLTTIDIAYRSVEFDKKLSFPIAIPNGYKQLRIK